MLGSWRGSGTQGRRSDVTICGDDPALSFGSGPGLFSLDAVVDEALRLYIAVAAKLRLWKCGYAGNCAAVLAAVVRPTAGFRFGGFCCFAPLELGALQCVSPQRTPFRLPEFASCFVWRLRVCGRLHMCFIRVDGSWAAPNMLWQEARLPIPVLGGVKLLDCFQNPRFRV